MRTMKYKNEDNTSETHKLYIIKKRSNTKDISIRIRKQRHMAYHETVM